MLRSTRLLTGFVVCATPFLIGAAKPKPTPQPFIPALAYKYGATDIRLSNADGSQAVLLVRKPKGDGIMWLSLAPLNSRKVAFIESTGAGTIRSLRIASWDSQNGAITVNLDQQPIISSQTSGMLLASLDFSPDGTMLAVLSSDYDTTTELRFFDVASRHQVGVTFQLSELATSLSWRASNDSVLLRGTGGVSEFKPEPGFNQGLESHLFDEPNQVSELQAFNGTSAAVILPYKNATAPGGTVQRWDGTVQQNGQPVLFPIADGIWPSLSCDNSQMIYAEMGAHRRVYVLTLATSAKAFFSQDSNVQRMAYPKSCD